MEEPNVTIYASKLFAPHLTIDFQISICKKVCEMNRIKYTNIIIDENGEKLLSLSENKCNYIVIYTFACLGTDFFQIKDIIDKYLDVDIKILSFSEPIEMRKTSERKASENSYITASIGFAIGQNDIWEEMINFKFEEKTI